LTSNFDPSRGGTRSYICIFANHKSIGSGSLHISLKDESGMSKKLRARIPFHNAEARHLAMVFGIVYFAQGMWYLPNQPITFALKERFGYSATQVATLFSVTTIPWLLKPAYGLLSDFVPLFGRRRKSYFLLTSGLAAVAGLTLGVLPEYTPLRIALLFTTMGFGLAFTDVLTDALMVENGKIMGLTGSFQAVQWAAIDMAFIAVGVAGGALTAHGALHQTFLLAALFPLLSLTLALFAIHEPRVVQGTERFRATWIAIHGSFRSRDLWAVVGFILFWTFSPSIGTPLYYYQTDTLHFSQQFIGALTSLSSAAGIIGALAYGGFSRTLPLKWLLNGAIGIGVVSTLAYLGYQGATSAILINTSFGCIGRIATLAFLDLAARVCPKQAEGMFFALLMSLYNAGVEGSAIIGGWLYDILGYTPLILISAAFTALCWVIVPLVHIERFETHATAKAREQREDGEAITGLPRR
jgi:predicted MFS family arabinose efflux permease